MNETQVERAILSTLIITVQERVQFKDARNENMAQSIEHRRLKEAK